MAVCIRYQDINGDRHDIEWICPSDYSFNRAVESFFERYPTATFIAALRLDAP